MVMFYYVFKAPLLMLASTISVIFKWIFRKIGLFCCSRQCGLYWQFINIVTEEGRTGIVGDTFFRHKKLHFVFLYIIF